MARTPSTMLELKTSAPYFSLETPKGEVVKLDDFSGKKGLIIVFMCNHCPYVQLLRESISEFAKDCQKNDVGFVAINSNDFENYPDDSPEKMLIEIDNFSYTFPYLIDKNQETAKAYKAACTPDFYLFDEELKLVYRGQYDDARPGNGKDVSGKNLKNAVTALLASDPIPTEQIPSLGCNIKWIQGNEPDYFAKS